MEMTNIYAEYAWEGLPKFLSSEREIYLVYDRAVAGWASGMQAELASWHRKTVLEQDSPVECTPRGIVRGEERNCMQYWPEAKEEESSRLQYCPQVKGMIMPEELENGLQGGLEVKGIAREEERIRLQSGPVRKDDDVLEVEENTPQGGQKPEGAKILKDERLPEVEGNTPSDGIELKGVLEFEAGEGTKTLAAAMEIVDFLLDHNAGRDALLLAMGGGTVTDVAGFAASIYKRGIRFATLPTTLLSQVDAAIGGKTGVNYRGYKNIIGTIRMPEFVWCASCTLRTLDDRQIKSGLAEMLKTFLIADADKYIETIDCLSANGPSIPDASLIAAAGRIKADIVQRDPYESWERRVLNLGHTIGHALEWLQQREGPTAPVAVRSTQSPDDASGPGCALSHGEAVAIGIVAAARIAERLGLAECGLADRIAGDFLAVGLPTELPVEVEALREAILQDKKASLGKVKFVLPVAIGRVVVKELTIDIITGK